MKVNTDRFGMIKVENDKIITMPFGMPGFTSQKQFILLRHRENSPFSWYQSVEDPALAFVITNPYLFMPNYKVDMDNILKELSWTDDRKNNPIELYVVVNIPRGSPDKITVNLIGPILINNKARQAVQVIISDSIYSHKFPISHIHP